MCRLFGFRSNSPARVHRCLVDEKQSLRFQSNEHKDGWGIAYYGCEKPGGKPEITPEVARGLGPAHSDPEFERVSNLLSSHAVVAHVRLASVGAVHHRNAHPFVHGEWTFCHNGTVREFVKIQPEVEALIDPRFRPQIKGETDSERCFYAFLSELGPHAEQPRDALPVAIALARTMTRLIAIADRPELEPSSLNFLVTDGRVMVATRRNRSLYFALRDGQTVIASEKLTAEDPWQEVPENSVVGVEADLTVRRWTVAELTTPARAQSA